MDKEDSKRNNKTFRRNNTNPKSFNEINFSLSDDIEIPKEIIWKFESDIDKGALELAKFYDHPVMVTYFSPNISKQPKNCILNKSILYASCFNYLDINLIKREIIKFYYPDGNHFEYLHSKNNEGIDYDDKFLIKDEKNSRGQYQCRVCKTFHKNQGDYLTHKQSNVHTALMSDYIENRDRHENNMGKNEWTNILYSNEYFYKDYIKITVNPNKNDFSQNREYRKNHLKGHLSCMADSSTLKLKGYGKKSANKTKGRKEWEKYYKEVKY